MLRNSVLSAVLASVLASVLPSAFVLLTSGLAGCADQALTLRRVVLYQNGIGYFERSGTLHGDSYRLRLRSHEVGDVLKSMVVIDQLGQRQRAVSAAIPMSDKKNGGDEDLTRLDLLLGERGRHNMTIAYAAPTPVWKPSYRVVLPDGKDDGGLLQAWAIVHNASGEPWQKVELVLATGAPLSFALDLQRPEFAARPDLNGRLVRPVATGLVQAEQTRSSEEVAGRNNQQDTDHDGIPDVNDKCPNEPETYNGLEDDDGCPDRGRVIVRSSNIEILDKVYFERDAAQIKPPSTPILDAIVATLKGNPEILLIEVQGHACSAEAQTQDIAQRRAVSVQSYLLQHGIDRRRLEVRGYGATRPIAAGKDEASCAKNRRAEFVIKQRRDEAQAAPRTPSAPAVTANTVAQSAMPSATSIDIAGATYYTVSDHVTLPQGASTMVSMLTLKGGAEDIYLFRPDHNVVGSDRHPLRAARLRIGMALEPGPVAVFARGSFVGEGVLGRMHAGETALLPYALDSATSVQSHREESQQPLRLLSVQAGQATVEDEAQRITHYEITTGAEPPPRIFVRHARYGDYKALALPEGTEESLDAYLVPHALSANGKTTLALTETRLVRHNFTLRTQAESVCAYLQKTDAPPAVQNSLRALCALQKELRENRSGEDNLHSRLDNLRERAEELRNNLQAIEKIATAGALRQELLNKLRDNERQSGELQKQVVTRSEAQATQEARLSQLLSEIEQWSPAAPTPR